MAVAIKMPDLGTTVDHVKLVKWLKQEGEFVQYGEPLCEVETDKAAAELESIAEGFLLRQVVPPDTEVSQGDIIAYVGQQGEAIVEPQSPPPIKEKEHETHKAVRQATGPKASMLIKNLARQLGVDLNTVTPTGPDGRITRQDLLRARESAGVEPEQAEQIALSRNQLAVARQVSRSHREIPAINLTGQFEISSANELRRRILDQTGEKITFDTIFIFAVSRIMKDFPYFQSRLAAEKVVRSPSVNIGCAIDLDEGLFTPVIKDVANKDLPAIERELQQLIEKVRNRSISPDEMTGATLTVSNLGMYPVRSFNMIIPPGQVAALAIGTIQETPVIKDGQAISVPVVSVTLSVDHRLINGRQAGQFLAQLKEFVENL